MPRQSNFRGENKPTTLAQSEVSQLLQQLFVSPFISIKNNTKGPTWSHLC